jgi:Ca2+-binding RTX toxin-like protein
MAPNGPLYHTPFPALELGLPDAGGDDILRASLDGGGDALYGGGGDDILIGHDGEDNLFGSTGDDIVTGGDGGDTFHFNLNDGHDIVADFRPAEDEINIWFQPPDLTYQSIVDTVRASPHGDAVITIGETTVTLAGIAPAEVSADWFVTINY